MRPATGLTRFRRRPAERPGRARKVTVTTTAIAMTIPAITGHVELADGAIGRPGAPSGTPGARKGERTRSPARLAMRLAHGLTTANAHTSMPTVFAPHGQGRRHRSSG